MNGLMELLKLTVISLESNFFETSIQKMTIDGLNTGGMWDIPTQKRVLEIISKEIGD